MVCSGCLVMLLIKAEANAVTSGSSSSFLKFHLGYGPLDSYKYISVIVSIRLKSLMQLAFVAN